MILITGASSGMGKEFAKALLKEEYKVIGAARSVDKMSDIKKMGAEIMKLDISKEESIQSLVDEILKNTVVLIS